MNYKESIRYKGGDLYLDIIQQKQKKSSYYQL
jgi:hypothetical protein